jgi:hypothetical protein
MPQAGVSARRDRRADDAIAEPPAIEVPTARPTRIPPPARAAGGLPSWVRAAPRAARDLPRAAHDLPRDVPRPGRDVPRAFRVAGDAPRVAGDLTRAARDVPRVSEGVPGRRTVTISGRGSERYSPSPAARRRPQQRRHERPGFRPDRAALWAVLLGALLILVAAGSSHAALSAPHASRIAPPAAVTGRALVGPLPRRAASR